MIQILFTILMISLWCLGFRTLMKPNMILERVRNWGLKTQNRGGVYYYIMKMTLTCVTCLASFHGLMVNLILCSVLQWKFDVLIFVVTVIPAAFINDAVWHRLNKV